MLIFVQVYRTIDKKFETIYRFWMNKREQRNWTKRKLKSIWRRTAPEVRSAPEEMTSSETSSLEASSSEAVFHQKLKFIELCKLEDSKDVQWIGCRIYIAKEWKRVTMANSKGFKSTGCLFLFEALTKYKLYELYNHYLHYPEFVSATRQG